jgi:hypothetical protein
LLLISLIAMFPTSWQFAGATTPVARAATGNPLSIAPSSGPPGQFISVAAVATRLSYLIGDTATVYFDTPDIVIGSPVWAQCSTSGETGFGLLCDSQLVTVIIPEDATIGDHTINLSIQGITGSAIFTVTPPHTATVTDTPSDTPTSSVTSTPTVTDSPSATYTATATASPTLTTTASNTATTTGATSPTITATAVPSASSTVRTVLPTPTQTVISARPTSTSPPARATATATAVSLGSISLTRLQQVQGGCQPVTAAPAASAGLSTRSNVLTYAGGQRITLHAAHLAPNLALDLIVSGPRQSVTGAASVPIEYSPPSTNARTDRAGNLKASFLLPDDSAEGTATVLALPHEGPPTTGHPVPVADWTFHTTPRMPSLHVTVRDATGRPIKGATITYLPESAIGPTGVAMQNICGRVSTSNGAASFQRVSPGANEVLASVGGRVLGTAQARGDAGATTSVEIVSQEAIYLACAASRSQVFGLSDRESGGPSAHSGNGPFGTFISGVKTLDTFTAFLDQSIDIGTPITLSFAPASGNATGFSAPGYIKAALGDYAPRVAPFSRGGFNQPAGFEAFAGPWTILQRSTIRGSIIPALAVRATALDSTGTGNYFISDTARADIVKVLETRTYVFPDVDLGRLSPGTWHIKLTVGNDGTCASTYVLHMIDNPWKTPLGTITPFYDRASHAYFASANLPDAGLVGTILHFQTPNSPVGWDPIDVQGLVTIPGFHAPFPELASSDAGIDVNERLFTSGRWDGLLSAHARVSVLGISLADSELSTASGSGQNVAHDQITVYNGTVAGGSGLGGAPLVVVPIGFPGIAGGELKLGLRLQGSLNASVGIAAALNRVTVTFTPALVAALVASAEVDLAGSSAGVNLNGNLIFQAPVSLNIPGGVDAHLAIQFSVSGHAFAHFCFISCSGPDVDFTIVAPTCLVGDCSVINPAFAVNTRSLPPISGHGFLNAATLRRLQHGGWQTEASPAGPTKALTTRVTIRPRTVKEIFPAKPAIAVSPSGHQAALWVESNGGVARLLARIDSQNAIAIASSRSQIAAPTVTWIGANRALAVWVGNITSPSRIAALGGVRSRPSYPALANAISGQELYSSVYDGAAWSAPQRLTYDSMSDSEPVLASNPARGQAALLWTHSGESSTLQGVLTDTAVYSALYNGGRWSSHVALTPFDGARAATVAARPRGGFAAAWLVGTAAPDARYLSNLAVPRAAVTVNGLPAGLNDARLAFDGNGRAVLAFAAAGSALLAARQTLTGAWTVWPLGTGSLPRLTSTLDGSVLLLAAGATDANGKTVPIAGRVLQSSGGWGGYVPLAANGAVPSALAAAVDPRTGALRTLTQGGTLGTLQDAPMQVRALQVPDSGHISFAANALALSPPQPAPGARAGLQALITNTGIATLPAGQSIQLSGGTSNRAVTVRLTQALPPGMSTTLRTAITMPAAPLVARAQSAGESTVAILGAPPAPLALGAAKLGGTSLQLTWSAGADQDIQTYRIYRGIGTRGRLSIVGIARGALWQDGTRAGHTPYRYLVTAVDRFGRESQLSSPLMVAS